MSLTNQTQNFSLIYTTFPSKVEAEKFIKLLLEKKLIACANLLPQVKSFYSWQGKIKNDDEHIAFLKTKKVHLHAIEEFFNQHHPYECPCLLTLKLDEANMQYLKWWHQNC